MTIIPATELAAVNEMLAAISEAPVESLDEGNADVQVALQFLQNNSRLLQSKGWAFNTETYKLSPTLDTDSGHHWLILPANTLRVHLLPMYQHHPFVMRHSDTGFPRLYDRENRTFNIEKSVKAELVLGLDFEEMPQPARDYITATAGYQFSMTQMGAEPNIIFSQERVREAYSYFLEEEIEASNPNVLRDSPDSARFAKRFV